MSHVIAVSNQKGGVGKTTTTINVSGALAEMGYRLLLIDMDPQASLGVGLGIDIYHLEKSTYHVIVDGEPLEGIIVPVREQIDLVPSNIFLSAGELHLASTMRREDRLKKALRAVREQYDFIIIDCPPSLGLLTINALSAADAVLIPMSCDYYSLVGVRLLLDSIMRAQDQLNPELSILGLLATRFDSRTRHSQEVLDEAREKLGQHVRIFDTVIRETVKLKEAPVAGQMITEYSPRHSSAASYRELAQEIVHVYQ